MKDHGAVQFAGKQGVAERGRAFKMQGKIQSRQSSAVPRYGLEHRRLQKRQRAEPQHLPFFLKIFQFAADGEKRIAQRRNARVEKTPGGKQAQGPPRLALEQGHPQFLFQLLYLLAHGRRGKAEYGGCAAYAPGFGHIVERPQILNKTYVDIVHGFSPAPGDAPARQCFSMPDLRPKVKTSPE